MYNFFLLHEVKFIVFYADILAKKKYIYSPSCDKCLCPPLFHSANWGHLKKVKISLNFYKVSELYAQFFLSVDSDF